jgi:hypothetical protein
MPGHFFFRLVNFMFGYMVNVTEIYRTKKN